MKLGNVQVLEVMVKNGASVNELDTTKDHFTPLHWACHVGSLEVRHCLLFLDVRCFDAVHYIYIIVGTTSVFRLAKFHAAIFFCR